jgi:hypothetical protein
VPFTLVNSAESVLCEHSRQDVTNVRGSMAVMLTPSSKGASIERQA